MRHARRRTAFAIETVFPTLRSAASARDVIFDLAVPGDQILGILEQLPPGAAVLIQKPMGPDLETAHAIRACCRDRGLTAAVNFQLRFSPNVLVLRDLLSRAELGEIVDVDVRIVIDQPWHRWPFLETAPRLEVPYHSIHYLDAIRWLVGEPRGVYCRVVRHPSIPTLARHAQLDHSGLRRPRALLVDVEPYAPSRPALPLL